MGTCFFHFLLCQENKLEGLSPGLFLPNIIFASKARSVPIDLGTLPVGHRQTLQLILPNEDVIIRSSVFKRFCCNEDNKLECLPSAIFWSYSQI